VSKLMLNPEFNLYERKGQAFCSSRQVAEEFSRQHKHILDTITKLTEPTSGLSEEFILLNFEENSYRDSSGKRNREYLITKDGFTMVVMEFKTKKARQFKEAYINRFNAMEEFIKNLATAKLEHPAFTDAVMLAHEEPKHYHFSNESNMINRIVLGMDAKQFKQANGIDAKTPSIRPYLTTEQIAAIVTLQRADIGLLVAIPDFQARKQALTQYYERLKLKRIA
jgi:Rha family phage regulatory protein